MLERPAAGLLLCDPAGGGRAPPPAAAPPTAPHPATGPRGARPRSTSTARASWWLPLCVLRRHPGPVSRGCARPGQRAEPGAPTRPWPQCPWSWPWAPSGSWEELRRRRWHSHRQSQRGSAGRRRLRGPLPLALPALLGECAAGARGLREGPVPEGEALGSLSRKSAAFSRDMARCKRPDPLRCPEPVDVSLGTRGEAWGWGALPWDAERKLGHGEGLAALWSARGDPASDCDRGEKPGHTRGGPEAPSQGLSPLSLRRPGLCPGNPPGASP